MCDSRAILLTRGVLSYAVWGRRKQISSVSNGKEEIWETTTVFHCPTDREEAIEGGGGMDLCTNLLFFCLSKRNSEEEENTAGLLAVTEKEEVGLWCPSGGVGEEAEAEKEDRLCPSPEEGAKAKQEGGEGVWICLTDNQREDTLRLLLVVLLVRLLLFSMQLEAREKEEKEQKGENAENGWEGETQKDTDRFFSLVGNVLMLRYAYKIM